MHCRTNNHDVYADLLRDITRRQKIRRYLRTWGMLANSTLGAGHQQILSEQVDVTSAAAAAAPADDGEAVAAASRGGGGGAGSGAAAAVAMIGIDDHDVDDVDDDDNDDDDNDDNDDDDNRPRSDLRMEQAVRDKTMAWVDKLSEVVPLAEVATHLPCSTNLPFTIPVPFADRLGLFLADGAALPQGSYPAPDDGQVVVFPFAALVGPAGEPVRVHARNSHYGKSKYSFVELQAGAERWYARVWILFHCVFRGATYKLAMASVMKRLPRKQYNTQRRTFTWNSSHLECFELGHILRTVVMVPSYIRRRALDPEVFHLLE